eukprot:s326_g27.t2
MPLRSPGVDGRSALQQLQYHDSSGERRCICIKTFADGSRGQTPLMLAAAHIGGGSTNAVETMKVFLAPLLRTRPAGLVSCPCLSSP